MYTSSSTETHVDSRPGAETDADHRPSAETDAGCEHRVTHAAQTVGER
jgi:hypothetical protein